MFSARVPHDLGCRRCNWYSWRRIACGISHCADCFRLRYRVAGLCCHGFKSKMHRENHLEQWIWHYFCSVYVCAKWYVICSVLSSVAYLSVTFIMMMISILARPDQSGVVWTVGLDSSFNYTNTELCVVNHLRTESLYSQQKSPNISCKRGDEKRK